MKIYLAPLEGITGWIFRSAVHECFGGFDKYFVPYQTESDGASKRKGEERHSSGA